MEAIPHLLILSFLANCALGFVILVRNPRSELHICFAGSTFFIALWNAAIYIQIVFGALLWVGRAAFSFAVMGTALFLIFVLIFPERRRIASWLLALLLTPAVIFFIIPFLGDIFLVQTAVENGQILIVTSGSLYPYYTPLPPSYIIASIGVLLWKYIRLRGAYRLHVLYLLIGSMLFLLPAVMTNLLLPNFFGVFEYNALGPVFSLFLTSASAYAILRFRLFDMRLVFSEGVLFASAIVALMLIFIGLRFALKNEFVAAVLAFSFAPLLKHFFYDPFRSHFFGYAMKHARILQDVTDFVRDSVRLTADVFLSEVLKRLQKGIDVESIGAWINQESRIPFERYEWGLWVGQSSRKENSFLLTHLQKNPHVIIDVEEYTHSLKNGLSTEAHEIRSRLVKDLQRIGAYLVLPIVYKDTLFGAFFLGRKLTQDSFTIQDLELTGHIAQLSAYVFALKRER